MSAAQVRRISPRLAMASAGCAALVAGGDDAAAAYEAALAVPGGTRWPFERARIQLTYGEWLHRQRDPGPARMHLWEARTAFEALSAQPWVRRTERQLRAAGENVGHRARPVEDIVLTEHELEVARLAAAGMTNREIGQQLFLSHRTIGATLYKIFPKLGITSRAMLGQALGNLLDP
jgi:DNA-binding CsgD family transcriptional regulator